MTVLHQHTLVLYLPEAFSLSLSSAAKPQFLLHNDCFTFSLSPQRGPGFYFPQGYPISMLLGFTPSVSPAQPLFYVCSPTTANYRITHTILSQTILACNSVKVERTGSRFCSRNLMKVSSYLLRQPKQLYDRHVSEGGFMSLLRSMVLGLSLPEKRKP